MLKGSLLTSLRCLGINASMLIAAAVVDIILSAVLLRFSSAALTITCFAVAGVFSGVFCYSSAMELVGSEQRERASRHLLVLMAVLCTVLFFVAAPLSGWEYNWPVRFFAVAEVAVVLFLWKNRFYNDVEAPGNGKGK